MPTAHLANAPTTASEPTLWRRLDVDRIHERGTDLVLIQRQTGLDLVQPVERGRVGRYSATLHETDASMAVLLDAGLAQLRIRHRPLRDDMLGIMRSFVTQFRRLPCNLRIELVDVQNCPKFHCDAMEVRLIVTYFGPSTEYCDADRPNEIGVFGAGSIGFLKGAAHPTFDGPSILHRSPLLVDGDRRLCLILDF